MTKHFLELATQVAREAGDYALAVKHGDLVIDSKRNEMDLVTQVDQRNERVIRDTVLGAFPDHIFLGEEYGASREDAQAVRWIVDPIDGTVNFAHGLPIWSVSIGVQVNGRIGCGVVYHPSMNEMFTAIRGEGAWLNGEPIHVSTVSNPKKALFVTGFPHNVDEDPGYVIEQFAAFLKQGLIVRRLGSAAIDLAYVACGRIDAFWEAHLSPWDTAAGLLLVQEAGGRVTHYDGSEFDPFEKGIIASNGIQHDLIMTTLSKAARDAVINF